MRRFATVLLLLVFCAMLRAEKFETIGTINIRGLSDLTPKLTQLLQNVDPKKKSFPVIAAAAITFNPEMRGFDLSNRIKFFYYMPTESKGAKPVWCMLVNRVSGVPLPEQVSIMDEKAFTKAVDTRALVSNSNELLNTLSEAPALADTMNEIDVQFFPSVMAKINPHSLDKLVAWTGDLLTNGEVSAAETEKFSRHNEMLKQLMVQTASASVGLRIRNDRLEVNFEFLPEKKTKFAEFMALQAGNDNSLPGLVSGKNISAAFNVSPFPPAQKYLAKFLTDLESNLSKQEQKDYLRLMLAVLANSNGKLSYFMEDENDHLNAYARFYCNDAEAAGEVDKALKGIPSFPVLKNNFSQLYAGKNDAVNLYSVVKGPHVVFAAGKLNLENAEKLVDSVSSKLPDLDQYGMLYANVNFNSRQYLTAEMDCAKNKSLRLRVTLFAAMLKKFVPENIEKQQQSR